MLRTPLSLSRLTRPPQVGRADVRQRGRTAVLAGLLVFVVGNFGLGITAEMKVRVRDPFYGDKLAKLNQRRAKQPDRPLVLMLGTSRTGFGFHGLRFEDRLAAAGRPVTAFNFGIPASGPIMHHLYLRRFLADGVKPQRLFLEILPTMLADTPGGPVEQHWLYGDRLRYSEIDTVCEWGLERQRLVSRWRESTFTPWYGLRFQLLGRVVQSWIPWQLRFDWSRGTDACGWGTPLRDSATDDERARGVTQATAEYGVLLRDLTPGGPAGNALERLLAECCSAGIGVTLVLMPEGSTFRSLYPPDAVQRLKTYLNAVAERHQVSVIDAREWLPDDHFTDGHHLFRKGAEAFTDRLAECFLAEVDR